MLSILGFKPRIFLYKNLIKNSNLLRNTINSNAKNCVVKGKSGCVPSYWINNFDSMPVDSSIDEVCGLLGLNGMNAAEYNTTVKDMKTLINKLSNKYPKKQFIYKKFFLLEENTQKQLLIEL